MSLGENVVQLAADFITIRLICWRTPRLFVTDTLGDPFADLETGQGIYREISKSRTEANKVKRSEPITVVIGNPRTYGVRIQYNF
jgi:hypothetical protein